MIADGVRIQVLGCGDAFNSGGRGHASFLVASAAATFLIDCGPTVLAGMKAQQIQADDLDAIFISHLHGDHFGGVPFLLLELDIVRRRTRELVIAGPPGIRDCISAALDLLFPSTALHSLPVRYVELEPGAPAEISGVSVTAFPVVHVPQTNPHALRLELDGRTIGYSGDTEWTDTLLQVADGADVFLCECSVSDPAVPGHLDVGTVADKRGMLRCRRAILIHMGEDVLRRLPIEGYEAAGDGMRIRL